MAKILCMDDDQDFCEFLASFFDSETTELTKVHTVTAAKKRILSEDFDAILLDRDLPDGNGLEVAEEVRKKSGSQPVLAMITSSKISINEYMVLKKKLRIDFIMAKPLLPPAAKGFIGELQDKIQKAKKKIKAS